MSDVSEREVDYFKYCQLCANIRKTGKDEPCASCLERPFNYGSEKPVFFEKAEKSSE